MAANLGASAKAKRSHAKGKRTITTQSVKKHISTRFIVFPSIKMMDISLPTSPATAK